MSGNRRYSLRELIEKVHEYMELDEELNERRARDYVNRVLQERPGQGARNPYTDEVLYKLLLLLRIRQQAPKLELMDIGRIIRSLPPEVVERVGKGNETIELPAIADPEIYARHLLGREQLTERKSAGNPESGRHDEFSLEEEVVPAAAFAAQQSMLPLTTTQRSDSWRTIPTARGIRLQIRGKLTVAQQRQLEHIGKLIEELVGRR